MSEPTHNDLMLTTLLSIKQDIGELRSDVKNFGVSLTTHIEDDKKLTKSISKIDDAQKRIKWIAVGAASVLTGAWKLAEFVLHKQ